MLVELNPLSLVQASASLIGFIGGILGIISWRRTRKIQKYQIEEIEQKKKNKSEEDAAFELILLRVEKEGPNIYWSPEVGSNTFRILERLVERGKIFRSDTGEFIFTRPREFKI